MQRIKFLKSAFFLFYSILTSVYYVSCTKEIDESIITSLNSEKLITSFSFSKSENPDLIVEERAGTIDFENNIITIGVSENNTSSKFTPNISISEGAIISPESNIQQDFTSPVVYTVTSENGGKTQYTVVLRKLKTENSISNFEFLSFDNNSLEESAFGNINEEEKTIKFLLPFGTDITTLSPSIVLSDGATSEPKNLSAQDFTSPVSYKITAADGSVTMYTVRVNKPLLSERDALIKIYDLNSDVLNWQIDTTDISTWQGVKVQDGKVVELRFTSIDLSIIPREIENLIHLETFSAFFESSIREIPTEFYNLQKLKSFTIIGAEILFIDDKISNLSNLENLSLSRNKLTSLPESICELKKLKRLDVKQNNITMLPQKICDLETQGVQIFKDDNVICN